MRHIYRLGCAVAVLLVGAAVSQAQDWTCHQGKAYAKPTPVGVALWKPHIWKLHFLTLFGVRCEKDVTATNVTAKAHCSADLWSHVYNPQRLIKRQDCISVTGTIVDATHGKRKDGVRKEADGDCHGWLKLDKGQESLLNEGNRSDEDGNLVYEVVCLFPVSQADAKAACKNYKSSIHLAPVGSHVRITGSFVQDTNHAKWNEIHPVSAIEVLSPN